MTRSCRWKRRATSQTTRWHLTGLSSGRSRASPRKSERPRRQISQSCSSRGKFSHLKRHINTVYCACSVQAASGNGPSLDGLAKILIGEGPPRARVPPERILDDNYGQRHFVEIRTVDARNHPTQTHLSGRGRLETAQRWARRKGWATFFQAAEESGQHEAANRGGVALAGPLHISTEVPASFEATLDDAAFMAPAGVQRPLDYLRSRILARHVNAMLKGGVTLVTVYLEQGVKASGLNLWLLEALAVFCLGFDGPWIAMGDWNMEPTELARSGWVDLVGGKVVAPDSVTCAGGTGSTIDYFVVSAAMAQLVQQVQVLDESPTTPHWPVRLTLTAKSWGHRVLALQLVRSSRRPHSTGPGRQAASQRTSNWPGWSGSARQRQLGAASTTSVATSAGLFWEGAKG